MMQSALGPMLEANDEEEARLIGSADIRQDDDNSAKKHLHRIKTHRSLSWMYFSLFT